MRFLYCFIFTAPFTTSCLCIQAQNQIDKKQAFTNAEVYYQQKIKDDALIYIGKEYAGYQPGLQGFPFYMKDKMQVGDIFYNGNLYKNVPLLFDIFRQEVVIDNYNKVALLQLLNEKITYFIIDGNRFEKFSSISNLNGTVDAIDAFYEVAFTGKASVLIKRQKIIKKGKKSDDPNFSSAPDFFIEKDVFFIRNANKLFQVTGKNQLLNALESKRASIKKFIRQNHLHFKKNIEKDLITTAAYYSSQI